METLKGDYGVVVIGGGPAGCAAAITAARGGASVLLLEQASFPRHKVCGEFVSPEALALLEALLGTSPLAAKEGLSGPPEITRGAIRIPRARIYLEGRSMEAPIQPPAASITRYDLDHALWRSAEGAGVECRSGAKARKIEGAAPFEVACEQGNFRGRAVILCAGRWSNLAPASASISARPNGGASFIGLKAHFIEPEPEPVVELYFFPGGYCGVQPVAKDRVNVCCMVRPQKARSLEQVFALHPELRQRSRQWQPSTETVSTYPLAFRSPVARAGNLLLAGDSAGFVDPFAGDGISLALHTGALAAQALLPFWRGDHTLGQAIADYESAYRQQALPAFRGAAWVRRLLSLPPLIQKAGLGMLRSKSLAAMLVRATRLAPEE